MRQIEYNQVMETLDFYTLINLDGIESPVYVKGAFDDQEYMITHVIDEHGVDIRQFLEYNEIVELEHGLAMLVETFINNEPWDKI